ncbi:MAG: acyl-CoA dehydratase activase-related protein [Bifidobacteriaceae bacterium]|jgi:predicted CoA-substrate-specific enzyme activase|nr:acyl-CoA dehydratase activase-related protein [Bifidobacteriaceae bacterium]
MLNLGIDVGSTTIKTALIDDNYNILYSSYDRHNSDISAALVKSLRGVNEFLHAVPSVSHQIADFVNDLQKAKNPADFIKSRMQPNQAPHRLKISITGSAGVGVATRTQISFVQEVVAQTKAVQKFYPDTDVIIELGGEDAKITYVKPSPEQRMNGTCAGGTGAFIDQMSTLLKTDPTGLNELSKGFKQIYPIASRCGVFAKTDLQPLINDGVAPEDLAASIFTAVASQTISGLANGRPIKGNVLFLGGPLYFMDGLRDAFKRALDTQVDSWVLPDNGQIFVAFGTAFYAQTTDLVFDLDTVINQIETSSSDSNEFNSMPALFKNTAEYDEFLNLHNEHNVKIIENGLKLAKGPLYLGIDAGSTTIKATVINDKKEILYSYYSSNDADPIGKSKFILDDIYSNLKGNSDAYFASACSTGYGEGLIKTALNLDYGVVETVAHYTSANYLNPGVTSIIDIGGQDMKYISIVNGVIDSIAVNEACSSGCGSFLSTFATAANYEIADFAKLATTAKKPSDLGSRCTVFMNSSVKQAQKEGAEVADIAAGLSYSVIRNALYKVIKLHSPEQLGEKVVVQGGTFLNDAVLRAFELLTGRTAVRPNISGLMGAYGAALYAQEKSLENSPENPRENSQQVSSSIVPPENLQDISFTTESKNCGLCQNNCKLSLTNFANGDVFISGNRCERGGNPDIPESVLPNLYKFKYDLVFNRKRISKQEATRGKIGIPRVLNMFENYPFWHALLSNLGYQVVLSAPSSHKLFESGMATIASENICYPAKLAHGHIQNLLDKGVTKIFYPCVSFEEKYFTDADNNYNCPVVAHYPNVIRANIEAFRNGYEGNDIDFLMPYINLDEKEFLIGRIQEIFDVTKSEATAAVHAATAEDKAFKDAVKSEGERALKYMNDNNVKGVVLAGRPYHIDPEINHGIPETINALGVAVLTEDSVSHLVPLKTKEERNTRVMNQWSYHSRLYKAAEFVAVNSNINLVQLNSFGCGLDAVTTDQVAEILAADADVYTMIKIDEVSNLGAAKIRLRSLQASIEKREPIQIDNNTDSVASSYKETHNEFTKEKASNGTLLLPQMAPIHFNLLEALFQSFGYNAVLLKKASKDDIEVGLKYTNNDSCFPAILVCGQLINAFVSGKYDPETSSVFITQTGGMCRATNYLSLIRKGLVDAGYPQVPVLPLSVQGFEKHEGLKLPAKTLKLAVQAFVLGDLLSMLLLRTRPYEKIIGDANREYNKWDGIVKEFLSRDGYGGTLSYKQLIHDLVDSFDQIPLKDIPRKARVGIVGEILVKYSPDANNDLIGAIENEGLEAVLPGIFDFFLFFLSNSEFNNKNLAHGSKKWKMDLVRTYMMSYQKPIIAEIEKNYSHKFEPPTNILELRDKASEVISLGVQSGEGWLLTAEIIELIESGTPNVVCAQPFACLPNHIVGKGVFGEIRRQYPQANLISIDYDPGASEVNQINRLKLLISTALENLEKSNN